MSYGEHWAHEMAVAESFSTSLVPLPQLLDPNPYARYPGDGTDGTNDNADKLGRIELVFLACISLMLGLCSNYPSREAMSKVGCTVTETLGDIARYVRRFILSLT
jgi:hypothetical protein